ncbi:MAG: hypothetical protein ACFFD1_11600, partial [Candidatus Thorarchaeota archaeon]
EELIEKEGNDYRNNFYVFRYRTPSDSETSEHVLISIKGQDEDLKEAFKDRLETLMKNGIIQNIEPRAWNFDHYVFGEKGLGLAQDLFALGTEFAIRMREKFGKLVDPQNEYPDEVMNRFVSPGVWLIISSFFNAAGYSPLEEINAYITGLQSRLRFMSPIEAEKVRNMLRLTLDMI